MKYLKATAASAGLAATAMYGTPARADWMDVAGDFGAYLSYTFGEGSGGGVGVGVQGRVYSLADLSLCGDDKPIGFVAGTAQLGLIGWTQPRLAVTAQAGAVFGEMYSAGGELGVGYRLGDHAGLETIIGAELVASYLVARGGLDPKRSELGLGLGFRVPGFDRNERCAVIGRALRIDEGIAERPELRVSSEQESRGVTMWCDRARTEWASVPAFFELAEQLTASGAPAALVDRAYEAASDEVRHAILSAGIASMHGGGTIDIASTNHAPRAVARGVDGVVRLAVESWIDGCLGEGLAANIAKHEARLEQAPARIRTVQRSIARDEHQHAELAWDIVAWAIEKEPDAVRAALSAVRAAASTPPEVDASEDLRAFGALGKEAANRAGVAQYDEAAARLARMV